MKDLHFSIILYVYGVIAGIILFLWILTDHFLMITKTQMPLVVPDNYEPTLSNLKLFNYDLAQYGYLFGISAIDTVGMSISTISFQLEPNIAFITLIGYMTVIYSFIVDVVVFKRGINLMELAGSFVIIFFTLLAVVIKLKGYKVGK